MREYMKTVLNGLKQYVGKIPDTPAELPESLPNPHPLHFTGAVEATYDGSVPVEVVIPQGGGGGTGGTGAWELIGEVTSDGAGQNYGIYLPIDMTQYKEVYIEAVDTVDGTITYRLAISSALSWSSGDILTSVKRAEKVMHSIRITNINGEIKILAATNSGYSGGTTIAVSNSPRKAMGAAGYKYIRLDTSNAGATPEGCTLKAWGYK